MPPSSSVPDGPPRRRHLLSGSFWALLYICIALAPLVVALIPPTPPQRDLWTELSVAAGFTGLSIMCLQFAVSARFRHVTAPYGIDVVLQFHRQIAFVAAVLIVAHPIVLFVLDPSRLGLLDILSAPWRARAGLLGLVALLVLTLTVLARRRLRLSYGPWRVSHGVLAAVATAAALVHIELVGHYLDTPWKRILWALYALSVIALLLHVRVVRPLLQLRRPYRVVDVRREAGHAWTLTLEAQGHDGLGFLPGQFVWLTLASSPFSMEQHPFSLSSSALRRDRISLTIKELGDFTSRIGSVAPGTLAYVEGPYGAFSMDRYEGPGCVFIAGGIGITPIMSMLRTLAERGDQRHHELIYAARSAADLTFRDELDALSEVLDLDIVYVLSDPPEGWAGETGRVTADLLKRHVIDDWPQHNYFVCGPPPMMDAVERALLRGGVPLDQIYSERFAFV